MISCRYCNAAIPDDSIFCPRCGRATHEDPQPFAQAVRPAPCPEPCEGHDGDAVWEYCQIEKQGFSRFERGGINQRTWFSAEAIGPRGKYSVGESHKLYYAGLQRVIDRVCHSQD